MIVRASLAGCLGLCALTAGCATAPALLPGGALSFDAPAVRDCTDAPTVDPLPFPPRALIGFEQGVIAVRLRYLVSSSGRVSDAVVERIVLEEGEEPLSQREVDGIRTDIGPQIEAEWRHARGGAPRVCETWIAWRFGRSRPI